MYEIGSEFNLEKAVRRDDFISIYSDLAQRGSKNIEFLRCGRDAIGFVADDIIAKNKGLKHVFIPALSCDSMVKPFEVRGMEVSYYKIEENLCIAKDALFDRIEEVMGGTSESEAFAVLIMNFFGIADTDEISDGLKKSFPNALIIEDVTHILMEPESFLFEKDRADYYVGSIRKWLGIPDGAFAISNTEFVMGALTGETDFTALRMQALTEKTEYLDNGDSELKTHFRELLSEAEDSLSDGLDPYHMSDVSADYLSDIDLYRISDRRRANYRNLYKKLESLPLCGKAFRLLPEIPVNGNSEGYKYTPFMLPIVLDIEFMRRSAITDDGKNITRDGFEKRLALRGIYAPVLWPIAEEGAAICYNAKGFSENMLAFWIDQRYSRFDMENIVDILGDELSRM
ncbi:hypothetical protein [Butyrivibrio sp. WCE2006]|uniref:hypothetical protein n=1 Tax=Butyrivibrio sp. WCE2006 TaxID=1410611 RepID=UPI0005D217A0|nr:hypothetical protein [Butyrivibrio sp. WCE2006]